MNFKQPSNLDRIFDTHANIKDKKIKNNIKMYEKIEWKIPQDRLLILSQFKDLTDDHKQKIIALLEHLPTKNDLYLHTNCLVLIYYEEIIGIICFIDHEYLNQIYLKQGIHNIMNQGITSNFIYIYNLVISPKWRKYGYAKYLLETLFFFCETTR